MDKATYKYRITERHNGKVSQSFFNDELAKNSHLVTLNRNGIDHLCDTGEFTRE